MPSAKTACSEVRVSGGSRRSARTAISFCFALSSASLAVSSLRENLVGLATT